MAKYGIISAGYWQYISNISGIYWQYISNMCSHQQQKDTSSEAGGWQPLHISRPTLCSKQSLAPLHICMVVVHLVVLVHLHGGGTFAWRWCWHICMARTPALAPKPKLRPSRNPRLRVSHKVQIHISVFFLQNPVKTIVPDTGAQLYMSESVCNRTKR